MAAAPTCVDCIAEGVTTARPIASGTRKPIALAGYERYEISRCGEVFSIKTGKPLAHTVSDFGYHRVQLRYKGQPKSFSVHRLVALTFVGSPESNDLEAMHLDHDPSHNHAGNVQWGTHIENVRATVEAGRHRNGNMAKARCPQGHRYDAVNSRGERWCRQCSETHRRRRRAEGGQW